MRAKIVGAAVLLALAVLAGAAHASEFELLATDGAFFDNYGFSVAISGDTAVVGAPYAGSGTGRVYVYVLDGSVWKEEAQFGAKLGVMGDHFGFSVAIQGDTIVVGAPNRDVGQSFDQGAAYVFTRSNGAWTEQAMLISSDGALGDQLGLSVALDGDTVVVGAPTATVVGNNSTDGTAYVFQNSGGTWSQKAKLFTTRTSPADNFGWSVGISGDLAIVGSLRHEVLNNVNQGSAFVFRRDSGAWPLEAILEAPNGAAHDNFGRSVAIDGNLAVIGAPGDPVLSSSAGFAYVFQRTAGVWSPQQLLTYSNGATGDRFGWSVALDGDAIVVGAPHVTVGSKVGAGTAYTFGFNGASWGLQTTLAASDDGTDDAFGTSVATNKGYAVVGAPNHAHSGSADGAAYVYDNIP